MSARNEEVDMETERELELVALELEGPDRPGESYLAAVGRITNAWMTARDVIAADTPPPEPDPENMTDAADVTSEWVPVVEDPRHPFWRRLREQEQVSQQQRDSQQ